MDKRIPTTLIIGFLGAGKTTLVNQLIQENQGLKLALVENEFGELGVDSDFLSNTDDLVLEMNDGCLCCSVRGDMVEALKNLLDQEKEFDHLIIEATGMASPGPILECFKGSRELEENYVINSVISLLDAEHFDLNSKRDNEDETNFCDQLAFADLILINKIENESEEKLSEIEKKIRSLNPDGEIRRTLHAKVDPAEIFFRSAYENDKIERLEVSKNDGEPFSWMGVFNLPVGKHFLYFNHIHDPLNFSFVPIKSGKFNDECLSLARLVFSGENQVVKKLEKIQTGSLYTTETNILELHVLTPGKFAFFMDDHPSHLKMELRIRDRVSLPECERVFEKRESHSHGDVNSVSILEPGDLDPATFQFFLNSLFMKYPERIYRSKGILSFPGNINKIIFQGVYDKIDFSEGSAWGDLQRENKVVFIGKKLNSDLIRSGFKNCLR